MGDVGADGLRFLAVFWNGLTVFGRKNNGFTVPIFLNGFQISLQNMTREVELSQN